jgi:hypothetical protein
VFLRDATVAMRLLAGISASIHSSDGCDYFSIVFLVLFFFGLILVLVFDLAGIIKQDM